MVQIINNGASLKIVSASGFRNIQKSQIRDVSVVNGGTTIKIDIGTGVAHDVFVEYTDVTLPVTESPAALVEAINVMLGGGSGGTEGTIAKWGPGGVGLMDSQITDDGESVSITPSGNLTVSASQNSETYQDSHRTITGDDRHDINQERQVEVGNDDELEVHGERNYEIDQDDTLLVHGDRRAILDGGDTRQIGGDDETQVTGDMTHSYRGGKALIETAELVTDGDETSFVEINFNSSCALHLVYSGENVSGAKSIAAYGHMVIAGEASGANVSVTSFNFSTANLTVTQPNAYTVRINQVGEEGELVKGTLIIIVSKTNINNS